MFPLQGSGEGVGEGEAEWVKEGARKGGRSGLEPQFSTWSAGGLRCDGRSEVLNKKMSMINHRK